MKMGLAAGGAAMGSRLLAGSMPTLAGHPLSSGDAAILKFLAAAELIETDLWQQYTEHGRVTTDHQNPYQLAFQKLDPDGCQYISSNTLDEQSHASFLNAYLIAKGEEPVDLDAFRTLPSSQTTGAQQIGRLTNLMELSVDTTWYVRYRSTSAPHSSKPFRSWPVANLRVYPEPMTISNPPLTSWRLPTRRRFTLRRLSKAAPACTPRSARRYPASRS
jgi:hypothetical protein